MEWAELWRIATRCRGEEELLDACMNAFARTKDLSLRAAVAVEVPSVQRLCYALDAHGVEVPAETELRLLTLYRLAHEAAEGGRER
jgi:hypothetical protein